MNPLKSIETLRTTIYPCHCDPMGHLTTAQYALLFDAATWALLQALQVHDDFGRQGSLGWADVEANTRYLHEVSVGTAVRIVSRVARLGTTSMALEHAMCAAERDQTFSTHKVTTVRLDRTARRAAPLPEELRVRIG